MDATADCAKQTRETETSGNMTNRNSLLGRSKPSERLTREEITALDKATVPPAPATTPAMASPSPGSVWRGAAAAKWSWSWGAGDGSDNPDYVNQEASMAETESVGYAWDVSDGQRCLVVAVHGSFVATWLERRVFGDITRALEAVAGEGTTVRFEAGELSSKAAGPGKNTAPKTRPSGPTVLQKPEHRVPQPNGNSAHQETPAAQAGDTHKDRWEYEQARNKSPEREPLPGCLFAMLLALDGWLIAHANKVNALRPSRK